MKSLKETTKEELEKQLQELLDERCRGCGFLKWCSKKVKEKVNRLIAK